MTASADIATVATVPALVRGQVMATGLTEFGNRAGGAVFQAPNPRTLIADLPLGDPLALRDVAGLRFVEIVDYLAELGHRLNPAHNRHLQDALACSERFSDLTPPLIAAAFDRLPSVFAPDAVREVADSTIGIRYLDGWVDHRMVDGRTVAIRAVGARAVHVIAGNHPLIAALTIVRNAVTRSDAIIKTPSNDPFTAVAIAAVILEKQDKVGGSTAISLGVMWIPNNPLMAREHVVNSYERSREYFDACVTYDGPGTTEVRREAFLRSGPEMVSFLERKGMHWERVEGFSDYYDELPGGKPRGRVIVGELFDLNELGQWKSRLAIFSGMPVRFSAGAISQLVLAGRTWSGAKTTAGVALSVAREMIKGRDVRGGGAALQGRMLQLALRYGIPLRLGNAVSDFIVENGRVVGVEAQTADGLRRIGARRGVLIDAGGFARNARMREQYGPRASAVAWTMANRGDTGEVMEAAMTLGAATDCMDESWWIPTSLGPGERFPDDAMGPDGVAVPFVHHMDISLPHVIVVDQDGNRFADESSSYMEKGGRQYERQRQTGRALPAWAIIDARHYRRYPWGTAFGPKPRRWLRTGYGKKADTVEGLAAACGIDPAGLRNTVERWNRFCANGVDEDYRRGARHSDRMFSDPRVKPNPNLGTIERGPFHAVAIYPSDLGTCGGLVTDECARVLRADGTRIDGLYATGNSTASVMGRVYPCGGASIAASFVFGYRAAQHLTGATAALLPSETAHGAP